MPHVHRRMLVVLDASVARVQGAAIDVLGAHPIADGSLDLPLTTATDTTLQVTLAVGGEDGGPTQLELTAGSSASVPVFGWFARFLAWVSAGREMRHATASVRAALDGQTP